MVGGNVDHIHRRDLYLAARPSRTNGLITIWCGSVSGSGDIVGILKRVIVSPAVYPRFLEIAELARSICHSWATCFHTFTKLYGIKNQIELAVIDFVGLRWAEKIIAGRSRGHVAYPVPQCIGPAGDADGDKQTSERPEVNSLVEWNTTF